MGAEPYNYVVEYDEDIGRALKKLRRHVFETGAYYGSARKPSTPEDALATATEEGTRSILDIAEVSDEPQLCCAAPFTTEELVNYFETERPSLKDVEDNDVFWDDIERGTARYIILYEGDSPKQIYFAGYSFD